ncbi:MAG: NAD(P)H-hydrate epimerase, partial [Muribaculaceae bacterium]|nr:NAD(P)H-hydrate epimerase [Muribaculaceae bacterium]
MKLFTNEQIRAIDRYTIESEGIAAAELIERVAEGVVDEITARWRPTKPTIIFAGPGNNGADALATARLLVGAGFSPKVYLFNIGGDKLSADCAAARDYLLESVPDIDFHEVLNSFKPPELSSNHLIVDGLFGSGLREELQGGFKALVQYINEENATVVSIDLPSGMFGDWNPQLVNRNTIHATLTLAIQYPRICFFLPDNADLIGEWKVLDIGLSEKAAANTPVDFCLIEQRDVHRRLRHRKEFASKNDFGSAVLYAGSYGMMGAAVLAARGAMRAGVGKLTVTAPKCG